MLASPYFLIGSLDAIMEDVQALRERHGISYVTVFLATSTRCSGSRPARRHMRSDRSQLSGANPPDRSWSM